MERGNVTLTLFRYIEWILHAGATAALKQFVDTIVTRASCPGCIVTDNWGVQIPGLYHLLNPGEYSLINQDLSALSANQISAGKFLVSFRGKMTMTHIRIPIPIDHPTRVCTSSSKNGVGCGLLGEQEAESIHITFNVLHHHYSNTRNGVDRLCQEHHRRTSHLLNHHRTLLQPKTKPEKNNKQEASPKL